MTTHTIPQFIYDHVRYGSGGRPSAALIMDGFEYSLRRDPVTEHVICTQYVFLGLSSQGVRIPLSQVPAVPAQAWLCYSVS